MANVIEIVMAITFLVLLLVANNFPAKSKEDVIAISLCLFVAGLVTWNCVNNVFLLKAIQGDASSFSPRSILFWFITVLFFLVCIFLIICLVASYPYLEKRNNGGNYEHYGMIVVMLWMLIIVSEQST